MKQIYCLSTCDNHKNVDSMRLQVVTTSKKRLVKELQHFVEIGYISINEDNHKGLYDYLCKGYISPCLFAKEINDILQNGYLQLWND